MTVLDLYNANLARIGKPVAAAVLTLAEIIQRDTLNPKDVAAQLAVSPETVIGWIRTGQLKAANIASGNRPRYIIQRAAVDSFLAMRQVVPPQPRRRSRRRYEDERPKRY